MRRTVLSHQFHSELAALVLLGVIGRAVVAKISARQLLIGAIRRFWNRRARATKTASPTPLIVSQGDAKSVAPANFGAPSS